MRLQFGHGDEGIGSGVEQDGHGLVRPGVEVEEDEYRTRVLGMGTGT